MRFLKYLLCLGTALAAFCYAGYASAKQPNQAWVSPPQNAHDHEQSHNSGLEVKGRYWFEKMQHAVMHETFQASFILLQPSGLQAYRWVLDNNEKGQQIELIEALNGAQNQVVRVGQKVIYFAPNKRPSVIQADSVSGPIPSGIHSSYQRISDAYSVVAVGGARVADREAQHIRLLPKNNDRYLYSLWIDRATGLLLGMNTYTLEGNLLEQILVTSISTEPYIQDEFALLDENWDEFIEKQSKEAVEPHANWKINFVPLGFEQIQAQRATLPVQTLQSDHFLYTDGMTHYSIYITAGEEHGLSTVEYESLITMVSVPYKGYNVTVVGKIPLNLAQHIASSIRQSYD